MQETRKMPELQGERHQQQDISTGQCCSCKNMSETRILFKRKIGEYKEKVHILLSKEEKGIRQMIEKKAEKL